MKVLYTSNLPSPYMVNYLNELGKRVDLTCIFERKSSKERGERWNSYKFFTFKGIILKGLSTGADSAFSPGIAIYLLKKYDFIIITNSTTFTGIFSIFILSLLKKKYIIESEGGIAKTNRSVKESVKKLIFSNSKYFFSANITGDQYFIYYGAKMSNIFRVPFGSVNSSQVLKEPIDNNTKQKYWGNSPYKLSKAVITVGRFITLKNHEWLIDSWYKLNKDYHLFIVGEGPLKSLYEAKIYDNKLRNVHIIDYMINNELMDWMKYFHLIVHPSLSDVWGLVLNEGLSMGLPVVATPYTLASSELISQNRNGYISEPNDYFFSCIKKILENDELSFKFSLESLSIAQKFTIDNVVAVHMDLFQQLKV